MNELLRAMEAAVERMEAVAEGILIEKRHKGVSPETHVRHMAGHLAQHAKIARAALEKANAKVERSAVADTLGGVVGNSGGGQ
jgi:hypothetical protein